jgi:hypothetical protein
MPPEAVAASTVAAAPAVDASATPAAETVSTTAAAPKPVDPLARGRAVAAQRIAAQRAAQASSQTAAQANQQLAQERAARAASDAKATALEKRIAELSADPVERWMREGKTPEQVRDEISKLGDPTTRELAELRKQLEQQKAEREGEAKAAKEAKERADRAAHTARVEAEFVAIVEKTPGTFPHLEIIPPRELVAMGRSLLDDTAAVVARRSGRPYAECRNDYYPDDQILLALNARIEARVAARKAKAAPAVEQEVTKTTGSPPGKKHVATAPKTLTNRTAPPVSLESANMDELSDKEQFALMAAEIEKRGGIKKKAAK